LAPAGLAAACAAKEVLRGMEDEQFFALHFTV